MYRFTSGEYYYLENSKKIPYIGFFFLLNNKPFSGKKFEKFKSIKLYPNKSQQNLGKINKLIYQEEL